VATQSVLSTRYCQVRVVATNPDGTAYNPTADTVQMAFMSKPPDNVPGSGDWHAGSWAVIGNGAYFAQVLVGPANGGVALTEGVYTVWAKVVDNPEIPTEPVGELTISP
jgi:hypothetical protein